MESDPLSADELLSRIPYLASLPGDATWAIRRAWTALAVPAGRLIFLEGEPCAGLYAIASGRVRIFKLSSDGKEQGLHLLGPGSSFNDVAVLDGGPNPASAVALEASRLYHLDRRTMQRLMTEHPEIALALVTFLATRVRMLVGKVEELAFHNLQTRLARLLLEQAQSATDDDELTLARHPWMTQQEIAAQLGTAREVVGRLLRQLSADGVIEFDRQRLVILDPDALTAIAEG